jgi:hypothetical protein
MRFSKLLLGIASASALLSLVAVPLGTRPVGAATGVPYSIAIGECGAAYGPVAGDQLFYPVLSIQAFNLPASADGFVSTGGAHPIILGNTLSVVWSVGQTPFPLVKGPWFGAPGSTQDGRYSFTDGDVGGGGLFTVQVAYIAPNGSTVAMPLMTVNVPPPTACTSQLVGPPIAKGSANMTYISNPPGGVPAPIVAVASTSDANGYWMTGADGRIYAFGDAFAVLGGNEDLAPPILNQPIVGMAATPDDEGYWLVASDGGVFAYGDAGFYGSTGGIHLNQPIVGMAATPDGKGYWLVASDGGIFAFGDAAFYGSMGGHPLNQPVVGMAPDDATGGYWLVAADGGVFSFNAPFHGSTGSIHLNQPVVGMEAPPDGSGYRFVAADGGVFCFNEPFAGSMGSKPLNVPITGMAPAGTDGYWLVAADGGVFSFDAAFHGSVG